MTVRLQQVVAADIQMDAIGPGNRLPSSCGNRRERLEIEEKLNPLRLKNEDHDFLMDRAFEMEDWDHYDQGDGEESQSEESSYESSEEDSSHGEAE